MMKNVTTNTLQALVIVVLGLFIANQTALAGNSELKRFVVVLDSSSLTALVMSQEKAAESSSNNAPEAKYNVRLKEQFRSDIHSYVVLESLDEEHLGEYFTVLNLSPISVVETEFTNSPEFGGGPKASETPRPGHKIYVIERGVPGISSLPNEKQIEISQGSQKVVAQIGDALEWDKSFLTQEGTFCVYRTDKEDLIKEHASIAGFPADKISAVEHTVYNF